MSINLRNLKENKAPNSAASPFLWFSQVGVETSWKHFDTTRGAIASITDTRIFSPVTVAGLCVTIGRYRYLFKRLTAVPAGRFCRFEHIVPYSSGKVVAK